MEKYKILLYFSWFITFSTFIYLYGGFHPDKVAKDRILMFSQFLCLAAHTPLAICLFKQMLKKEIAFKDVSLWIVSISLQVFVLSR